MIQRKVVVDVTLTPDELAFAFANMDAKQQAMFFNELANITAKWDGPFCFQMWHVANNPALTKEGKVIMRGISGCGTAVKTSCEPPPKDKETK